MARGGALGHAGVWCGIARRRGLAGARYGAAQSEGRGGEGLQRMAEWAHRLGLRWGPSCGAAYLRHRM